SVRIENANVVNVNRNNPILAIHFPPTVSNIYPVIGFMSPISMAPGSRTSPDFKAEYPIIVCIYNGKTTFVPIIAANTTIPKPVASVKVPYLNTLDSKSGSANPNCLVIKTKSETAPRMSEITPGQLDQHKSPAELNPYNIPPKPIIERI